jgi:hypothetical protein
MNVRLGEDDIPDLDITIVASTNENIGRALVGEAHCIDWPESTWALRTGLQFLTIIRMTMNSQTPLLSFDIINHDLSTTCTSHDLFSIGGEPDTPDLVAQH